MQVEFRRLNKNKIEISVNDEKYVIDRIFKGVYYILREKYKEDIELITTGCVTYKNYICLKRDMNVEDIIGYYKSLDEIVDVIKEYINIAEKNIKRIETELNKKIVCEL